MKHDWKYASPEMSKKLVELGVELDTEKYWVLLESAGDGIYELFSKDAVDACEAYIISIIPAPDVAELGKVLNPSYRIIHNSTSWMLQILDTYRGLKPHDYKFVHDFSIKLPEAQAAALALIWIIEKKHVKPTDLIL